MEEQIQAILEKYTDDLYYESPEGIDISDVKLVKKELNDLFSLHVVSQQRELLIAYRQMLDFDTQHETIEYSVDHFLKNKESYL